MLIFIFIRYPRHCPQGTRTPWSNRQWQVLLWGFEAAEGGHSAQTSRQVEEKQLVSPPWQCARSHITRCSTIPDFQKRYSDSPPPIPLTTSPVTFSYSPRWNYGWKGVILTRLRRSTQKCKRLSTHIWKLRGMHEIMGNTLGSLYTCPRGLLQRRRWKIAGVILRNFFLW